LNRQETPQLAPHGVTREWEHRSGWNWNLEPDA